MDSEQLARFAIAEKIAWERGRQEVMTGDPPDDEEKEWKSAEDLLALAGLDKLPNSEELLEHVFMAGVRGTDYGKLLLDATLGSEE